MGVRPEKWDKKDDRAVVVPSVAEEEDRFRKMTFSSVWPDDQVALLKAAKNWLRTHGILDMSVPNGSQCGYTLRPTTVD